MAENTRPPRQDRLLIKVIMPKQGTERKVPGGGSPPKPFRTVDKKYRASLSNQVSAIRTAIVSQIKTAGAAPVSGKAFEGGCEKPSTGKSLLGAILPDRGRRRPRRIVHQGDAGGTRSADADDRAQ